MNTGLDMAFFGPSQASASSSSAAAYYRGLLGALSERGHRATFYEPETNGRQQHHDMAGVNLARAVVYPGGDPGATCRAVEEASAASVIVKCSGVGAYDELLEAAITKLRSPSRAVAFWDLDPPATLERLTSNPVDPFRALLPEFDLVFTYGGGNPVVRAYESLGARRSVPICNALDPAMHHPVPVDSRFDADLIFVGNRLPDREARVRNFFFDVAEAMPERSLLLGGSGWHELPLPRNVRYIGHLHPRDLNAANVTPLAVLNLSRDRVARFGPSPAARVFEAAGAGACVITDAWEGISQFLEPDREVLVASNGAEVVEHLRSLKRDRARQIGDAARRRLLAEHTYAHRAATVEAALLASGAISKAMAS